MNEPTELHKETFKCDAIAEPMNKTRWKSEQFFLVVFILEMLIRKKESYVRLQKQ